MVDEPQTVVITGGQGELAQAGAQSFHAAQWNVLTPGRAALNVTEPAPVETYFRALSQLHLLIVNAGMTEDRLLVQTPENSWNQILAVNLRGAFLCAQAARPLLEKSGGQVIFIGSYVGLRGATGQSAYAAAKAGLIGLSASLAQEWGPRQIRSNVVLPGFIPTKMNRHISEEKLQSIRARHALGRFNTAQDTARFLLTLAHLEHVSGQVFQLDSRVRRSL